MNIYISTIPKHIYLQKYEHVHTSHLAVKSNLPARATVAAHKTTCKMRYAVRTSLLNAAIKCSMTSKFTFCVVPGGFQYLCPLVSTSTSTESFLSFPLTHVPAFSLASVVSH